MSTSPRTSAEPWDRDGFVQVDGFAASEIGHAMQREVLDLVRAADRGEDVSPALVLPEAQADLASAAPEDRISKVFRLHRRATFRSFLESDPVVSLVVERLGPDVDCFLSQFIFKNPGAWGQPWHQDSYYFPFEPPRPIVGLWLAVTEATLENGCLHVLPGSHREPVVDHQPDGRPDANYGYVEIVDHDFSGAVPVLMDVGDLLVFDSHLMHRSTDNRSGGSRAAMVFHCCRAGTDYVDPADPPGAGPLVNDWAPLVRAGEVVRARPA
jgi:ectoine hydroxylase-related dioxygenase (phytanoyl-CoA dioxygenase family)